MARLLGLLLLSTYMNVGKCDLTLSLSEFTFCSIKMKATSQITISTSFANFWGKPKNFNRTDFYIQITLKLAYEHLEYLEYQKMPTTENRPTGSKLKLLVYYRM
jgi:hypothetical protein